MYFGSLNHELGKYFGEVSLSETTGGCLCIGITLKEMETY